MAPPANMGRKPLGSPVDGTTPPLPTKEAPAETIGELDPGEQAAADEAMVAAKNGDGAAFGLAIKDLVRICIAKNGSYE